MKTALLILLSLGLSLAAGSDPTLEDAVVFYGLASLVGIAAMFTSQEPERTRERIHGEAYRHGNCWVKYYDPNVPMQRPPAPQGSGGSK